MILRTFLLACSIAWAICVVQVWYRIVPIQPTSVFVNRDIGQEGLLLAPDVVRYLVKLGGNVIRVDDFDLSQGKVAHSWTVPEREKCIGLIGKQYVAVIRNDTLHFVDPQTGLSADTVYGPLPAQASNAGVVCYASSARVVCGGERILIQCFHEGIPETWCYDLHSGQWLWSVKAEIRNITGRYAPSVPKNWRDVCHVIDLQTGTILQTFPLNNNNNFVTPSGKYLLAFTGNQSTWSVYEVASGNKLHEGSFPFSYLIAPQFLEHDELLTICATTSFGQPLTISWEIPTGKYVGDPFFDRPVYQTQPAQSRIVSEYRQLIPGIQKTRQTWYWKLFGRSTFPPPTYRLSDKDGRYLGTLDPIADTTGSRKRLPWITSGNAIIDPNYWRWEVWGEGVLGYCYGRPGLRVYYGSTKPGRQPLMWSVALLPAALLGITWFIQSPAYSLTLNWLFWVSATVLSAWRSLIARISSTARWSFLCLLAARHRLRTAVTRRKISERWNLESDPDELPPPGENPFDRIAFDGEDLQSAEATARTLVSDLTGVSHSPD